MGALLGELLGVAQGSELEEVLGLVLLVGLTLKRTWRSALALLRKLLRAAQGTKLGKVLSTR